jgi:hypothetical protein
MLETLSKHGYRIALGSLFPHDPFFEDRGALVAKYLLARVSKWNLSVLKSLLSCVFFRKMTRARSS